MLSMFLWVCCLLSWIVFSCLVGWWQISGFGCGLGVGWLFGVGHCLVFGLGWWVLFSCGVCLDGC